MKDILIFVIIFILLYFLITNKVIENFWGISTRYPYMSHDLRGNPNLIYRVYPDGTIYPDGYLYSPYFYTSDGELKHLPGNRYYIR